MAVGTRNSDDSRDGPGRTKRMRTAATVTPTRFDASSVVTRIRWSRTERRRTDSCSRPRKTEPSSGLRSRDRSRRTVSMVPSASHPVQRNTVSSLEGRRVAESPRTTLASGRDGCRPPRGRAPDASLSIRRVCRERAGQDAPDRPRSTESPPLSRSFADLGVSSSLLDVLTGAGITTPTPIQAATLPAPAGGRRTRNAPRGLILAPTRELARQLDDTLAPLAEAVGLRTTVIFGGVPQGRQVAALDRGVDIVVACPGRLEDLMGQKHCRMDAIEVTVLDEADHMADLGFLPGVTRILAATPAGAQRLLFSATLDQGVDKIVKRFLVDPVVHSVDDGSATPGPTAHHVMRVDSDDRVRALAHLSGGSERTVIHNRTQPRSKRLAQQRNGRGVASVDLHGNLSQNARVRNLDAFSSGEATVMVATDIAARGIHVGDVGLVIHADPPAEHKAYVHRSGRTARAG